MSAHPTNCVAVWTTVWHPAVGDFVKRKGNDRGQETDSAEGAVVSFATGGVAVVASAESSYSETAVLPELD